MTDGWIALHRKIYTSKDFNNQLEVAVFLYLVAMASHKPTQVIYRKKKINQYISILNYILFGYS